MPPIKVDGIEKMAQSIELLRVARFEHRGEKLREIIGVYTDPAISGMVNAAYVEISRISNPPATRIRSLVCQREVFCEEVPDSAHFANMRVQNARGNARNHIRDIVANNAK